MSDFVTAFTKALERRFQHFEGEISIEKPTLRSWASITFSGARLWLTFRLKGKSAEVIGEDFLQTLSTIEWYIPGYIVADVLCTDSAIAWQRAVFTLEVLLVEDN